MKWIAAAAAAAALALLAGCERSTTITVGPAEPAPPAPPAPPAAPAAPAAPTPSAVSPIPPMPPMPRMEMAYVGRWAATEALCANGAWDFEYFQVSTAGEVSCRFLSVKFTDSAFANARYQIPAICTAEGRETRETFTLTPGPGTPMRSMTVRGGPWSGPIELKRCPESRP